MCNYKYDSGDTRYECKQPGALRVRLFVVGSLEVL